MLQYPHCLLPPQPAPSADPQFALLENGAAGGTPVINNTLAELLARWTPGILRDIFIRQRRDACACVREMAANALSRGVGRFSDVQVLGEGTYGIVHKAVCRKSKKTVAIKTATAVSCSLVLCAVVGAVRCMPDAF